MKIPTLKRIIVVTWRGGSESVLRREPERVAQTLEYYDGLVGSAVESVRLLEQDPPTMRKWIVP